MGFQRLMCEEGAGPAEEGPAAPRSKQALGSRGLDSIPRTQWRRDLKVCRDGVTDSAGFRRGELTESVLMGE